MAFVCLALSAAAQSDITDLQGRAADPFASMGGRPVVLVFLRIDCPVSQRYAPIIQSLAAKYSDRASFWLVFPSHDDSAEAIATHQRDFGYQLASLRDPRHVLVQRAKATITPEAAIFDSHGQLRYHGRIDDLYVSFGQSRRAPTKHDLDDALAAVLAGKPVTTTVTPAIGCYISDVK